MDAYKLSTDYNALWDYIHENLKILGWVKRQRGGEDCVEVKLNSNGHYMIGSRGVGYETLCGDKDVFIENCGFYELKYIEPNKL